MTLLIRDVRILGLPRGEAGGERNHGEASDVFVTNDKISAIGSFPRKHADVVVDGGGTYLSPGFIDINTDSDHYLTLLDYPAQDDFLRQGVTTIIGGMCGSSLAPLIYGSLESVQKWGDVRRVNVNWHTVREFLEILEKKHLAVNFGTLAGHATIRRAIVGDALRSLTKNEMTVFAETLKHALNEGAFGLSTGLGYVHGRKTPYAELKSLAQIVKRAGGVYATHLRDTGKEIEASVDETIELTRETGVKIEISHFVPLKGAEKAYRAALQKIEDLPPDLNFNFDLYPFDESVLALYTFLPLWAQNGGLEVMQKNVNDEWLQPKIENDFNEVKPEDFVVAQAPEHYFLAGKSLRDLMEIFNLKSWRRALLKLMMTAELKATILYRNINEAVVRRALQSSRALVASNAASFNPEMSVKILKPERATATFTKFLTLAMRGNFTPLEEAIAKITESPARKFDLEGQGAIKIGNFADFTCFYLDGDEAKIKFTVINGRVVYKDGEFQKVFAGKILRHRI